MNKMYVFFRSLSHSTIPRHASVALIALSLSIASILILPVCTVSSTQNSIFFDNQSSEPALVKLVGPTSTEIEVPNGTKQVVKALAGRYTIKVRYGVAGKFHYTKGEEFEVQETETTASKITITLHKVVAGNYDSAPISEAEFNKDALPLEKQSNHAIAGVNDDFLEAAKRRDLAAVKGFIAKGANINAMDNFGGTALIAASSQGYKEVVRLLLAKGADVNAGANGNIADTALMVASAGGHTEVVQLLLDHGADVNVKSDLGTALTEASHWGGHKDIVQLLLAKGADVNSSDRLGQTALFFATSEGNEPIVQALLDKGADVNAKTNKGATALMFASNQGHIGVVELLLAKGADVNARANNGDTALMAASYNGHKEVVQLLLAKRADVNAKASNGATALGSASLKGYKEIKELLTKAGAK